MITQDISLRKMLKHSKHCITSFRSQYISIKEYMAGFDAKYQATTDESTVPLHILCGQSCQFDAACFTFVSQKDKKYLLTD